jgi:hypothetical protein
VIIPGGDGYLHSVDKITGHKNWVFKADGADDGTHQGGVIVNSFEGNVTQGPDQTIYAGTDNGKVKVVVFPAFYSNDSYHLMKETSKVFTLEGSYLGSELHLSGSFKISAMGGTIPFEIAQFFVQFNDQKVMGELVTESKCTKLQGNGVDFKFPMSIVDNTCDHRLRLIGVGKFDGEVTTIEQLPQLDYFADDNLIIFERAPHLTGSMLTLVYETKNGTHVQNILLNETQNFVLLVT